MHPPLIRLLGLARLAPDGQWVFTHTPLLRIPCLAADSAPQTSVESRAITCEVAWGNYSCPSDKRGMALTLHDPNPRAVAISNPVPLGFGPRGSEHGR